jgi:tripartite-type tricarboxylate transporter receptor subunit TctC
MLHYGARELHMHKCRLQNKSNFARETSLKHSRRSLLNLATAAAVLPALLRVAQAQSYPARPVRLIVGFPAGGASDIVARLIAQWLSQRLGQQFIVENQPGAGTNIATEAVVRAAADGYTLLYAGSPNAINATLYDHLDFNFIRDIAPVAGIIRAPLVMEVNPAFPAKSVPDFIAYAKANPGEINMASSGNGTAPHMAGELFKMMAGINMIHVPYRGGAPALTDLLAGRVQVFFDLLPDSIAYLTAGKLRPLAVTTSTRLEALPNVPTVGDSLPGYEASAWQGIGAPKKTTAEIIEKLNKDINAILADQEVKKRLVGVGGVPMPMTAAEFGKFVIAETEKWAKVIKFADIKHE